MRQQFLQIACSILASAALAAPALAQSETASVSGVVRDRHGAPQIDALVQLMRADSSVVAIAHTDASGIFLLEDLLPGVYQLKASDEAFLPSLRQNLRVVAHHKTIANITLSTLFDAVQWLPAQRRSPNEPADDWKWTLRSETNRPVLRFSDEGPVMVSEGRGPVQSRARVTTSGGLRDFGDGGLRHGMEYEGTGSKGEHTLLRTSLNATDGLQANYMAAYENEIGPGRVVRTVAAYTDMPDLTGGPYGAGRYQAATLRTAETSELTPMLRAEIGNELVAMRLVGVQGGTEVVGRPFGSLTVHFGDTTLAYRVATSRMAQDATALADDETLLPPVAQRAGRATLEHGLHQEIRLRHTAEHGATLQVAAFHDRTVNPMVQGSGTSATWMPPPAICSSIRYRGSSALRGTHMPAMAFLPAQLFRLHPRLRSQAKSRRARRLKIHTSAPIQQREERSVAQTLTGLKSILTPAVTMAAEGNLQKTATYWRASYRWQRADTVTAVNPYASPPATPI